MEVAVFSAVEQSVSDPAQSKGTAEHAMAKTLIISLVKQYPAIEGQKATITATI